MTEYEKMLKGKIYSPGDPETNKLAHEQHKLALEYNTLNDLDPKRKELIDKIFPNHKGKIYVQGNLYVDYGVHTTIGDNFYANNGLTILDVCPVTIGDNCWFDGNVTVLPGVKIGNGCVIGACSVVTHDIPDNYLAYGNPCKAIREITEEDSIYNKKELW